MMTIKFATQLKQLRQDHGMSQDQLAEKLFVSRQAISKWETGEGTPDLKTLVTIAGVFGVSLDTLILGVATNQAPQPDPEAYTYNPTTGLYTPRYGQMNFWDFLAHFWWLIFPIGGFVVWMVSALQ
ncbi:helix-turn-helix domain-containing protein [Secundilactobacillus kimchicus]|uniref:helix-turn-helix transcriptional regulator n=2 Tax=Secundilactobacillus TaxID=2767892 RepID=UPI001C020C13|nr:helix-turn-helix transcriptional regulator [Secundilactobacillus kimchicus]MBT9671233.1 helix-turn-helix domain-containing protein [Secundilactobacillus kimchicus]